MHDTAYRAKTNEMPILSWIIIEFIAKQNDISLTIKTQSYISREKSSQQLKGTIVILPYVIHFLRNIST